MPASDLSPSPAMLPRRPSLRLPRTASLCSGQRALGVSAAGPRPGRLHSQPPVSRRLAGPLRSGTPNCSSRACSGPLRPLQRRPCPAHSGRLRRLLRRTRSPSRAGLRCRRSPRAWRGFLDAGASFAVSCSDCLLAGSVWRRSLPTLLASPGPAATPDPKEGDGSRRPRPPTAGVPSATRHATPTRTSSAARSKAPRRTQRTRAGAHPSAPRPAQPACCHTGRQQAVGRPASARTASSLRRATAAVSPAEGDRAAPQSNAGTEATTAATTQKVISAEIRWSARIVLRAGGRRDGRTEGPRRARPTARA